MQKPIIEVRELGKRYRLGHLGASSLREEAEILWKRLRRRNGHGTNGGGGTKTNLDQSPLKEFWALRDVSFDVQPGEVVGIIGRNGAGKSTLLKILSRITEPTEGEVIMRGRVASLLEVGTGFHPELSGRENIYLNGAILGMKKAEIDGKLDEIVAFSEVEKFIDTPVKRYSSGMYVRLAFAVAAHLEPEILIVDEVLAVGDHSFQKKCLSKMQDISTTGGRTVIFVSHNMGSVASLCSECVYLANGQVVSSGNPDRIISQYLAAGVSNQVTSLIGFSKAKPDEKIRIEDITVNNKRFDQVQLNSLVTLSITITSDVDSSGLFIGLTLVDEKGGPVGGYISNERYQVLKGKELKLEYGVDLNKIAPGRYFFSIGLGHGGLQNLIQQVEGYCGVDIQPISESGIIVENWSSSWGATMLTVSESSL